MNTISTKMNRRLDHGEDSYEGHGLLEDMAGIVTGADSGIGRAVAIAFAREGADLVLSYLEKEEDAAETERLVVEAGRRALRVPGDIRSEEHCEGIIAQCLEKFGKLDVLVNNAACQGAGKSADDSGLKTIIHATFFLSRAALRHMKPGASIINTTGTEDAVVNMTRTLAESAVERGVRVNGVGQAENGDPSKTRLFKRSGQPAEMAPIYVFLASRLASYVTGEIYGATGGQMPL